MASINRFCKMCFAVIGISVLLNNATYSDAGDLRSCPKDLSSMYRTDLLESLSHSYARNIDWNFENVMMPVLTGKERVSITGVKLRYTPHGECVGDPFGISAEPREKRINIPIFSVKFLDDLAVAAAWSSQSIESLDRIYEYLSWLKFGDVGDFPRRRYPSPLEALGIPSSSLKDSRVDRLAQSLVKSYILYSIARQISVYAYKSLPYKKDTSPEMNMLQIIDADTFGLEIMRRTGVSPDTICFYIKAQTFWMLNSSDNLYRYALETGSENIVFPKRLHNIANLMVRGKDDFTRKQRDQVKSEYLIENCAREIIKLAEILESEPSRLRSYRW